MSEYQCKECGAAASVADGVITRTCGHSGTIVAGMAAKVYGISYLRARERVEAENKAAEASMTFRDHALRFLRGVLGRHGVQS